MLATLFPVAEHLITPLFPQLESLASADNWWEMHAHLLSLCGALLESEIHRRMAADAAARGPADDAEPDPEAAAMGGDEESPQLATAMSILTQIWHPAAPKHTRMWGLYAVSTGTAVGDPVVRMFLEIMESLSDEDRRFLLDMPDEKDRGSVAGPGSRVPKKKSKQAFRRVELPSSTGLPFVMQPVLGRWDPSQVTKGILAALKSQERLKPPQMQMLLACVRSLEASAGHGAQGQAIDGVWLDVYYPALKDFIIVGLCDIQCAKTSAAILTAFMTSSSLADGVLREPKLLGVLRLLYPTNPDTFASFAACQAVAEGFFDDVAAMGKPYDIAVQALFSQFGKNYPTQFEKATGVQKLLKDITTKLR